MQATLAVHSKNSLPQNPMLLIPLKQRFNLAGLAVPGVCTQEPQGLGTCGAALRRRTHLPGARGLRSIPTAGQLGATACRSNSTSGAAL
jgi:hypothetical protein